MESTKSNLEALVLAALFHDIGELRQRAGEPLPAKPPEQEKPTYWHPLHSIALLKDQKVMPLPESLEGHRDVIAGMVAGHHRPDMSDTAGMCLTLADRLSMGLVSTEKHEAEPLDGYPTARLVSIFDQVVLQRHRPNRGKSAYHKLAPLDDNLEDVLPMREEKPAGIADYRTLYQSLLNDLSAICGLPFRFYLESLIAILEKHTWCIPTLSLTDTPNISLFDHLRMTSTIAQALYLYHDHNGTVPSQQGTEEKFLFVGGDLSGIQDYIFGISKSSGRGVSKIFRARSFYLQALMRSVILEIERRTDVYSVCRVIDSGGKFLLLLPNIDRVRDALATVDSEIQDYFRKRFKGKLTLNLSFSVRLGHADFIGSGLAEKMDALNQGLTLAKLQKLKSTFARGPVVNSGYRDFQDSECSICEVNPASAEAMRHYQRIEKDESDIRICDDCADQISIIGTKLPKSNYLLYGSSGDIKLFNDRLCLSFDKNPPADNRLDLFAAIERLSPGRRFAKARLAAHLPLVTDEETSSPLWREYFKEIDDRPELEAGKTPKSFSMIAGKSKKDREGKLIGRPLLGLLKSDVDNLGLIFSQGLRGPVSLSRYVFLSRMMDFFFAEYLVRMVKEQFPDIYIVFAGGDDMFVVGPWRNEIDFALRLREHFTKFTADNPDISISAGIQIVRSRLPMRKAVELVQADLEAAKKHSSKDRLKDSVRILNETMSWQDLEERIKVALLLDKAVDEKKRTNFNTAFLHRLLIYHQMYKKFINNNGIHYGRYLALAHYDIARNIRAPGGHNAQEVDMLHRIFVVGVSARSLLAGLKLPLFYAINMNRDVE